uniref:Uncharacterized protein n=1 Tax=Schlesneria paludicola TaxID=360056 RepID=A0A7C4LNS7_9PLAN
MPETLIKPPVLKVTRYDLAVAAVIATFLGILAACFSVASLWLTNRLPPKAKAVPVEMFELPGGFEDGFVDESLRVDSPEPEVKNASPAETTAEQLEIAESLETVTELSDAAAEPLKQQFETGASNVGKVGSSTGTGRRGLGMGPGKGGIPREQRWFIRFADRTELDLYARQLDFFKIELGALLPDGRLAYLRNISSAKPQVNYAKSGKDETRMYMTWQAGERRLADVQLFAKAGVNVPPDAPIFHFYPPEVEAQLAQLERDYRGRKPDQIKRTYFIVESVGASGYRFTVVRQLEAGP